MSHAIRIHEFGGSDVLTWESVSVGEPGEGEVLIRHTAIGLNFINFSVVWRYFGWANQTLAAVTLWAGAVFLARRGNRWWLAVPPALFMTVVTTTYILVEDYGFGLHHGVGSVIGFGIGVAALVAFLVALPRLEPEEDRPAITPSATATERDGGCAAC